MAWHNHNPSPVDQPVAGENNDDQDSRTSVLSPGSKVRGFCQSSSETTEFEVIMFEGLFQPMHLLIVLCIALLVFGPKKLPELGKGLGDGIRSFKDSMRSKLEN